MDPMGLAPKFISSNPATQQPTPSNQRLEVCAYANNQHELGQELRFNPRETSFFRA